MSKILVITDKLYPDETGGSCTYAFETIIELSKKHQVDIFTCYPEKTNSNSYFKYNTYRNFEKKKPIKSVITLKRILQNNYDYIIFHSVYSWFLLYLVKRIVKVNAKQTAIFHGPWHKEAQSKYASKNQNIKLKVIVPLMKLLERIFVNDNEKFIFLSDYMRRELQKINPKLAKKQYKIIPGGVRVENYKRLYTKEEAREKLNISREKFVVFTLRRLEHRMGIQNGLESISRINQGMKDNTILLVGGTGSYKKELEKKSKELKVDTIFTGYIPDEKINLYFCASDLFLVPSLDLEGFGLVNLESLAMGVPVLATPQGGMVEVNDMFDNFYLSEENSVISLTNEIEKIYEEVKDKVIVEEKIKNYDWSIITQRILEYIVS